VFKFFVLFSRTSIHILLLLLFPGCICLGLMPSVFLNRSEAIIQLKTSYHAFDHVINPVTLMVMCCFTWIFSSFKVFIVASNYRCFWRLSSFSFSILLSLLFIFIELLVLSLEGVHHVNFFKVVHIISVEGNKSATSFDVDVEV